MTLLRPLPSSWNSQETTSTHAALLFCMSSLPCTVVFLYLFSSVVTFSCPRCKSGLAKKGQMTSSDQDDDTSTLDPRPIISPEDSPPFPYLLCLSEEGKAATPLQRRHQRRLLILGRDLAQKTIPDLSREESLFSSLPPRSLWPLFLSLPTGFFCLLFLLTLLAATFNHTRQLLVRSFVLEGGEKMMAAKREEKIEGAR